MVTGSVAPLPSEKLLGLLGDRRSLKLPTVTKYITFGKDIKILWVSDLSYESGNNTHPPHRFLSTKQDNSLHTFYSSFDWFYLFQFFFHKNMQIFLLFKFINLMVSSPCLKSFNDSLFLKHAVWSPYQDFHDYPWSGQDTFSLVTWPLLPTRLTCPSVWIPPKMALMIPSAWSNFSPDPFFGGITLENL